MIIIDSNCLIFGENETAAEHQLAIKKIKDVLAAGHYGINVIIASETFHILSRFLGIEEATLKMVNIVTNPFAEWIEFHDSDFVSAISLASESRIRINDALIAQQAIRLGVPILTDNLKDFKKVPSLKILPLR